MRLLLQRRLVEGDCCKWKTVAGFEEEHAEQVLQLAADLAMCVQPLTLRVIRGNVCHKPLLQWDIQRGWY